MKLTMPIFLVFLIILVGCTDSIELTNYDMEDSPVSQLASTDPQEESSELLSAFFGFNSEAPFISNFFVCRGAAGKDAMPVVFSHELDLKTLQAGDFKVVRSDGVQGELLCVTPAPAFDSGELRTMLLVGKFGSSSNQPERVEIIGNLLSSDNRINFKGKTIKVIPLEDGPSIVRAEHVPKEEWYLGRRATFFPFGGGSGCPVGTMQIVRVVWNGGITKPGGDEVDEVERKSYSVTIRDNDGSVSTISPFALGDLGDGDNNHKLCLDVEGTPLKVYFPEGLVTDPRDDLNPETSIKISGSYGE
jgi:hypothetical protein